MVLAYSPASKFAPQFAKPDASVAQLLALPACVSAAPTRGSTRKANMCCSPCSSPRHITKSPAWRKKVAGKIIDPQEIFTEPSLLARLQEGQIDFTIGYESAVISQHLPFIDLPPEINFSDPAYEKDWYSKASLTLPIAGKVTTVHPTPLVYYATVLKNAKHPQAAEAFVKFLNSAEGQALFAKYGYNPPKGPSI